MAVVIFSVVILSLVGLSFRIAKSGTRATDQALAMAVLLSKVDLATATSFDSLANLVGCTAVTQVSIRLDSVRIIVRTTLPGSRPDTTWLARAKWRFVPLR